MKPRTGRAGHAILREPQRAQAQGGRLRGAVDQERTSAYTDCRTLYSVCPDARSTYRDTDLEFEGASTPRCQIAETTPGGASFVRFVCLFSSSVVLELCAVVLRPPSLFLIIIARATAAALPRALLLNAKCAMCLRWVPAPVCAYQTFAEVRSSHMCTYIHIQHHHTHTCRRCSSASSQRQELAQPPAAPQTPTPTPTPRPRPVACRLVGGEREPHSVRICICISICIHAYRMAYGLPNQQLESCAAYIEPIEPTPNRLKNNL